MCKPASGTPARTQAIPADRIAFAIKFLEGRLLDSKQKADRTEAGRDYYNGRIDAFEVALNELREVSK